MYLLFIDTKIDQLICSDIVNEFWYDVLKCVFCIFAICYLILDLND